MEQLQDKKKLYKILFIVTVAIVSLCIRYLFKDIKSPDYVWFLKIWFDQIKEQGGFLALQYEISNYSPLYIYLIAFLTYLPLDSLYSIKLLSVIFDFVAAYYVFKLLALRFKDGFEPFVGAALVLLLPTVIINGSFAAQCDVIFSTFLIGMVYYFAKGKNITALVFFGIAVSFKLQAAFLAPLLLILLLKKRITIWQLFISPAVYIMTLLPAFFIGRPFKNLITIYFRQFGYYPYLTMNCANIYQFFPEADFQLFNKIGLVFTFVLMLGFSLWIAFSKKKLNNDLLTEISILILLLIPFFLPQMHERYFFPAELFLVVYMLFNKKHFYVSIALMAASFLSYGPFLFAKDLVDMRYLAVIVFAVIIFLILDVQMKLKLRPESELEEKRDDNSSL